MLRKIAINTWMLFTLLITALPSCAQPDDEGLGQTIQIYTNFHSFVGKPSWLLEIRDVDNDQSIPYIYDISRGDNFWIALTYGRNYLITASTLRIETYQSRYNKFKNYVIHDFCHLESNGRIIRGDSMYVMISGDLSPNTGTFECHVSKYPDANFTVVN